MYKAISLSLIMLALNGWLVADRFQSTLSYHGQTAGYLINLPHSSANGTATEIGTRFTAAYDIGMLYGAFFGFYSRVGNPTGITVKVHTVGANNLPGTELGQIALPIANIVPQSWNYIDLSALNLSFQAGEQFAITYSVTGGVANSHTQSILFNTASPTHSIIRTNNAWAAFTSGELFIEAIVDYTPQMINAGAIALTFPGRFTLAPGESVSYEGEIANHGETVLTNIPVTLEVADALAPEDILHTQTLTIATLNPGATAVLDTFTDVTYSETGLYIVTFSTGAAGDMDASDNSMSLEQQVVTYPAELRYDDGTPDYAWAVNFAGGGYASEFTPPVLPCLLGAVKYHIRGNDWPLPGSDQIRAVVYDDNGPGGSPGTILSETVCSVVRGEWNTVELPEPLLITEGSFFVAWHTLADYPNCPGLSVDSSGPCANWAVSWQYVAGEGWSQTYPSASDDYMIRAVLDVAGLDRPANPALTRVTGGFLLTWDPVDNAVSYNVYSGTEPDNVNELLDANIAETDYLHLTTEPKRFYRVTASSESPARESATKAGNTGGSHIRGPLQVSPSVMQIDEDNPLPLGSATGFPR